MRATLIGILEQEWFLGFLSGIASTFIGFLLTLWWEPIKATRESSEKDEVLRRAALNELRANLRVLDHNRSLAQQELDGLDAGKRVVVPLLSPNTAMLSALAISAPTLLREGTAAAVVSDVAFLLHQLSEHVRSREQWRAANQALGGFKETMRIYDSQIVATIDRALVAQVELRKVLGDDALESTRKAADA